MFDLDDVNESLGIEDLSRTKWMTTGELFEGALVRRKQVASMRVMTPGNPLTSYVDTERSSYLLELSPTAMVIEGVTRSSGFEYADTFVTRHRWEAYQPSPDSNGSVLRHSWYF